MSRNGERPRLRTNSATAAGMPRNAAALPRMEAPSTMSAIMAQVWTEPMAMARSAWRDSSPCKPATHNAPSTPTAAASDGVARPPYIEPSTHRIRKTAGPSSRMDARNSAPQGMPPLPPALGHKPGLGRVMDQAPRQEAAARKKPGEEARREQLGDRDVAQHAVDDHDVGWRDQEAQRAGTGQRPDS